MHKRGSILMISLWILAFLVVFAVGLGHRASLNLRLARYQKDRLKAYCLAKAGFYKAVSALKSKENTDYDSLQETWSTGKDNDKAVFENIEIKPGFSDRFSVKYLYDKDKGIYRCMRDEESLLNINKAPIEVLRALLSEYNLDSQTVEVLAKAICIWRGDTGAGLTPDAPEYKSFKKKPFSVPEELLIIFEDYYQKNGLADYQQKAQDVYAKIKGEVTAYGSDKLNINTVQPEVLKILVRAIITMLGSAETRISELVNIVIEYRKNPILPNTDLTTITGISGDTGFMAIAAKLNDFIVV